VESDSIRASGTVHVTMGCALQMSSIAGVGIRSHTGRLLLYGDVVHHKKGSPAASNPT